MRLWPTGRSDRKHSTRFQSIAPIAPLIRLVKGCACKTGAKLSLTEMHRFRCRMCCYSVRIRSAALHLRVRHGLPPFHQVAASSAANRKRKKCVRCSVDRRQYTAQQQHEACNQSQGVAAHACGQAEVGRRSTNGPILTGGTA